jgi:hypothetical protein
MPIPNLLHKTLITIRQQNRTQTEWDDDAREAIQEVKKDNDVKLHGQVSFKGAGRGDMSLEFTKGGVNETALGYILFRFVDLNARNIELQRNDQIVQMGHRAVDLWIERLTPEGHYADTDGPSLIKAHFSDRKPARNTPGD